MYYAIERTTGLTVYGSECNSLDELYIRLAAFGFTRDEYLIGVND